MNNIVVELAGFIQSGSLGPSLTSLEQQLDSSKLRVAIIKLLGWLKARSRTKGGRPLILKEEFGWARTLRRLVAEVEKLGEVFVIDGNELDFSKKVTDDEREDLLSFVNDAYQPRLMR